MSGEAGKFVVEAPADLVDASELKLLLNALVHSRAVTLQRVKAIDGLPAVSGAAAMREQNTVNWWHSLQDRHEMIDATEMGKRLGASGQRPANTANAHRRDGKLIGLRRPTGNVVFPAFQLDQTGHMRPEILDVLKRVRSADRSEEFALFWLTEPHAAFAGKTPLRLLDAGESDRVLDQLDADLAPEW
ncbi:antitoxin Xre/MbcA/ParS toxin-binding domain-containing protein [Aeromicrobium massiliense]|uniref:antitoxin Xre/MbcA/ParS toxin-binding domain-containing protein n=1 Tax=Aeromicrobium massiliense TaxID=1464554 RepID=UPI00031AE24A|nr:antitoxin Xre/MbcA/ParS toxin-binding domain-containing protein [Aeromicrobium massiliense]